MDQSIIFSAEVLSSDAGSYNIVVSPQGNYPYSSGTMQGIPLTNVLANFIGFKESLLIPAGTRVLCAPADKDTCWILGVIPAPDTDEDNSMRATIGGGNPPAFDAQNSANYSALNKAFLINCRRPTDVVAGEYVMSNEFGVLLGLFQQMATLKGSELAQVQCHVLDDLVRIIGHNFQQFSSLGELKIYHDGKRIGLEMGATHLPAESLGVPQTDDAAAESPFEKIDNLTEYANDTKNFYTLKNERLVAVERLKFFLGGLADFIQLILTAPTKDSVYTADGAGLAKPDRGLAQVNLSTDGGLYVRSLKEVAIEKTNWIKVPQRIRVPEDPKGEDGIVTPDTRQQFKFDQNFKFSNNPFLYCLQLRDYLAVVNENLGYLNFRNNSKDFYLNEDIAQERTVADLSNSTLAPKVKSEYTAKTSGIYLMPNGGVMIRDGSGSAIVMEGGNIYLQPAKDLIMQPTRNMVGKIGGFLNLAAYKDIDISSTAGGMRTKTANSQYLYSDKSGIVIESAGEDQTEGTPADDAITTVGGVVIKSATGVYQYGQYILNSAIHSLILESEESLQMEGRTDVALSCWGSGTLGLYAARGLQLLSKSGITIAGNSLTAAGIDGTTVGAAKQTFAIAQGGGTTLGVQGQIPKDTLGIQTGVVDLRQRDRFQKSAPIFQTNEKFDDLKFRFLKSDAYGLTTGEDVIPQTIAQQENTKNNVLNLEAWVETEVNSTLPYPGKDLFETFYVTNSRLDSYQVYENELYANGNGAVDYSSILQKVSLNTYTRKV